MYWQLPVEAYDAGYPRSKVSTRCRGCLIKDISSICYWIEVNQLTSPSIYKASTFLLKWLNEKAKNYFKGFQQIAHTKRIAFIKIKEGVGVGITVVKTAKQLKEQVTIDLEKDVIQYFEAIAQETGISYVNLINLYLRECMENKRKLSLIESNN